MAIERNHCYRNWWKILRQESLGLKDEVKADIKAFILRQNIKSPPPTWWWYTEPPLCIDKLHHILPAPFHFGGTSTPNWPWFGNHQWQVSTSVLYAVTINPPCHGSWKVAQWQWWERKWWWQWVGRVNRFRWVTCITSNLKIKIMPGHEIESKSQLPDSKHPQNHKNGQPYWTRVCKAHSQDDYHHDSNTKMIFVPQNTPVSIRHMAMGTKLLEMQFPYWIWRSRLGQMMKHHKSISWSYITHHCGANCGKCNFQNCHRPPYWILSFQKFHPYSLSQGSIWLFCFYLPPIDRPHMRDADVDQLILVHYSDVTMSSMAFQINNTSTVCSTVCWGAHQRKHQSFVLLAFWRGSTGDWWIPFTN